MNQTLQVGELARLAGVSVRTLHHYQEIGLLLPSARSSSGYRLYGAQEVVRLQQITSLREIGLSLAAIRDFLDDDENSPATCLSVHIAALDEQIARQTNLRDRLNLLLQDVERQGQVDQNQVLSALREINDVAKHFSSVQIEQLKQRADKLGEECLVVAQTTWTQVLETFRELATNGATPTSAPAQEAAKLALQLIAEFSGNDAAIENGVAAKYREEGAEKIFSKHGMPYDEAGWTLMQQAMEAVRNA